MKTKWIAVTLIALLAALQARLWFGKNSIADYQSMQAQISELEQQNVNLKQRNALVKADITDLELGIDSMEERARHELGLIKEGETFYRILPRSNVNQ
ncbi:cell division protein FtsB [Ningiella sp. W23]|uniref:cell division protein FtsB n=1 Tax=Ningiella sp. W23 TaxID=3023715 RepID=UPI00375636BB